MGLVEVGVVRLHHAGSNGTASLRVLRTPNVDHRVLNNGASGIMCSAGRPNR